MAVLDTKFKVKAKNNIIFFIIYTIGFILICKTFPYITPFIIGGLIAIFINPISQKLKDKLHIDKGLSTIVLSFIGVALVISLGTIFILSASRSLIEFVNNFTTNHGEINNYIIEMVNKANLYISQFQEFANYNVEELINKYSIQMIDLAKGLLASIINLATSIPYIVLFTITLFISTYFIAKDIDKMENGFYNIFTDSSKKKVQNIKREIILSIIGYIKAYTILITLTFLVIWASFSLLGIPYGFILGVVGGLLDLVPFLGIVVIFIPVIIYYFLAENYFVCISITIIFIALSLIRQILEPKLVSVNIGINPLASVAAIFIGIQIAGLLGIIFCLGLVAMHEILKKVEIL